MSGALVPAGGFDFQQQGQVDWVSLSKSCLDVLVRLNKAELSPVTVVISHDICGQFVIKPDAQRRIHDALSRLGSFSTYGRLVWFGLGIKPILKDIAETEHGMACIALCACMATSYDSFYVATVLREMCTMRATRPDHIPAIHQWKTLVNICAGSLSHSKFPTLLEGLLRLVRPCTDTSLHKPTPAEALAKAIKALADVSNQKLGSVTIAGGLDSIWLAAVAEWLLSLDVEIRLNSGCTIYRSSVGNSGRLPVVNIVFVSENEQPLQVNQCFVVPKGRRLWFCPAEHEVIFRGGRSEWETILEDTFGPPVKTLLEGRTQQSFAHFLYHTSRWAETIYRYGPVPSGPQRPLPGNFRMPFSRFHFSHPSSTGQGFLEYAAQRLPELAGTLREINRFEIESSTITSLDDCIDSIAMECMCQRCGGVTGMVNRGEPRQQQFCLVYMAEVIVLFLWILSTSEVEISIKPSPRGLQLLYLMFRDQCRPPIGTEDSRMRWKYTEKSYFSTNRLDILTAVLMIFSGSVDNLSILENKPSALCRDGVCIFFRALEDLDLPPDEASIVRVVPGQIDFDGTKYDRICDPRARMTGPNDYFGPNVSYTLVVQETPQPGCLSAAYRISCNLRNNEWLLGISALERAIVRSVQGQVQCGALCGQVLPWTRGASVFASNCKDLSNPLLLTHSWSLLSVPRANNNGVVKLRIIQATIYRLYLEIARFDLHWNLAYLDLCDNCVASFPCASQSKERAGAQPTGQNLLDYCNGTESIMAVAFPSGTGSWANNCFDTLVAERSRLLQSQSEHIDRDSPEGMLYSAVAHRWQGILQLLLQGGVDPNHLMENGNTALHSAAGRGFDEMVEMLMAWGAQVGTPNKKSDSPLLCAVVNDHGTTASLLLERGAEMKDTMCCGSGPLSQAAARGRLEMVERLLKKKENVDWALMEAAGNGHLVVVERLLQEGGDVNAILTTEKEQKTALQAAASNGHLAVVERLLQANADVNVTPVESGMTALQAAANGGHLDVVTRLLQEKAELNAVPAKWNGRAALQAAAGGGHLAVVERLLQEEELDINAAPGKHHGRTALQAAAEGGHLPVIERLLQEKELNVNAAPGPEYGRTAIQAAAGAGHQAVIERLLQEKGVDINAAACRDYGRTALQAAAESGNLAVVDRLLREKEVDINAEPGTNHGRTALQVAAESGNLAMVERLLGVGANVNGAPSKTEGRTALQAAAEAGHLLVVERLLQEKADVNAGPSPWKGKTALQAAAGRGHLAIVERLLQVGADINAAPPKWDGETALEAAASHGHVEVVERLLQEKVDVNARPARREGSMVLEAAAGAGHLAVVERLLREKADVNLRAGKGTPLEAAVTGGHLAVAERLRQAGAIR